MPRWKASSPLLTLVLACGAEPAQLIDDAGPRPDGGAQEPDASYVVEEVEGWDEPPGTGFAFVVDAFALSASPENNTLWQIRTLLNDPLRQSILGGESLIIFEIVGLDEHWAQSGNDESLTVKIYEALDADDPPFPANNFSFPPGEVECCGFRITRESLTGIPIQARFRAPARIRNFELQTLTPIPVIFPLALGLNQLSTRFERALLSMTVPPSLSALDAIDLHAAWPINSLNVIGNPFCQTANSLCPREIPDGTLLDLVAGLEQPDVDLDIPPDGLEHLEGGATGRVERCTDGCPRDDDTCVPEVVDPLSPTEPWTCASRPEMADGYSFVAKLHAVRAAVVGVGP